MKIIGELQFEIYEINKINIRGNVEVARGWLTPTSCLTLMEVGKRSSNRNDNKKI